MPSLKVNLLEVFVKTKKGKKENPLTGTITIKMHYMLQCTAFKPGLKLFERAAECPLVYKR